MLIPRWETFMACADNHGDKKDPDAIRAFFAHLDAIKPKHRIHMGDGGDFRALRRKATAEEQREHMGPDVVECKAFIVRFRPTVWMLGNHEFRLWDNAANASGARQELCQHGVDELVHLARSIRAKLLPYHIRDGVERIGKLSFLHGFFCGVNAARRHAAIYGPCLFGHTHTIDEASVPGLEGRVAQSIGCLCQLDQEYNSRTPSALMQRHGWAYGAINKVTGDYLAFQARKTGNEWIIQSNLTSL